MSRAFECDRCDALRRGRPADQVGTHDEGSAGGHIHIESPSPNMRNTAVSVRDGDLCEDCAEAFRQFWGEDA